MPGNSIGEYYQLTSFGESHGDAIGGVIDGCPAGLHLSVEAIQQELARRRPGYSPFSTTRKESDQLQLLSGLFQGVTTGMPIGFLVYNQDKNSSDYEEIKHLFRPSHADYSWQVKYGIRDYRGGGRSSAREHVSRVVAGAVAKQCLGLKNITLEAYTSRIGMVEIGCSPRGWDIAYGREHPLGCPDREKGEQMVALIRRLQEEGDSVGGVVSCIIRGVPAGVGEPVFHRFQARLAHYMMGINAAKGFEYGEGFHAATMRGSEHNDPFYSHDGKIRTATNHSGGVQGGVTNGEDIFFRVAFKPVPTIAMEQQTVTTGGDPARIKATGRHDPCVIPRVLPVVEAMAAMLVLDMMLEGGFFPRKINEK